MVDKDLLIFGKVTSVPVNLGAKISDISPDMIAKFALEMADIITDILTFKCNLTELRHHSLHEVQPSHSSGSDRLPWVWTVVHILGPSNRALSSSTAGMYMMTME